MSDINHKDCMNCMNHSILDAGRVPLSFEGLENTNNAQRRVKVFFTQ